MTFEQKDFPKKKTISVVKQKAGGEFRADCRAQKKSFRFSAEIGQVKNDREK